MKARLSEIVEIKSGYLFKSRIVNDPYGQVRVIQLKDIDDNGAIYMNKLLTVSDKEVKGADFLRKGDIIFKSKSARYTAAVFNDDSNNAIITVHFFLLRLKTDQILPAYLAWYINQKPAQRYFKTKAGGTRIPIVTKKILEELEVSIPSLPTQEKIVAVNNLFMEEKKLLTELREKRQILVNTSLLNVINRS
ncbi:MAG: hypothetical protein DRP08_03220 [Candidatus Aenigmatarchaeota archaeon]|nr:MAG: hypothetical protein DRP08_03220 [Candidatus Aenigmarchaeota archaeon]